MNPLSIQAQNASFRPKVNHFFAKVKHHFCLNGGKEGCWLSAWWSVEALVRLKMVLLDCHSISEFIWSFPQNLTL